MSWAGIKQGGSHRYAQTGLKDSYRWHYLRIVKGACTAEVLDHFMEKRKYEGDWVGDITVVITYVGGHQHSEQMNHLDRLWGETKAS